MIGNYWYPECGGGLERYFCDLVEQLAAAGHDIDFFVYGNAPTTYKGARGISLGPLETPLAKRLYHSYKIFTQTFAKSSEYDLVDIHFALSALPAVFLIPRQTPIIYHFQGPWALESQAENAPWLKVKLAYLLERFVFSRCKHFFTASQAFALLLAQHYGIDPLKISVVALSINTDRFCLQNQHQCRRELGWDEKSTIAFVARRLVNRVGIHEIIQASAQLATKTTFRILIAGRGPMSKHFQTLIDNLQINQTTQLIGYLNETDLAKAYSAANLVVLPTQELEGFGLAFAESLAAGTPVLVTPIGGMPEYLNPLSTHLVTTGSDPNSIANALERLLLNPSLLPDSATCRTYALQHFSWPRLLRTIITCYEKIITAEKNHTA